MYRKRKSDQNTTENILGGLNDLVKLRKEECAQVATDRLKYHSMYANLDRLLSKLPESTVESLSFQFYNMAYSEFQKTTITLDPLEVTYE